MTAPAFPPIAIVGLGAMFPGRGTTAGFWRDLVEAADTTGPVPETHWLARDFHDPDPARPDHTYSHRGAFIPAFAFDPVENGTPPRVVETTDTVQLMALQVARAVLAEAEKGLAAPLDRERISVVLGVAAGTELMQDMSGRLSRPMLLNAMRADGIDEARAERVADRFSAHFTEWRESTFPGLLGNVVAGRIANRLDLGGVNFTADAACASSLAALRHACQELHEGDSDLVLSGGADALNAIFMYMCFSKTPAMSVRGRCSPFSDDADGTLMGEGAGIVALRRLEDAERDGNAIHAVIRGIGAASDGRATSVYAPRSDGQARAIRRAHARAGFAPESIELVEAHGTGTRAGDLAEIGGLKQVFGERAAVPWCALGSVKSQIGHTKSAAGAASLIKCALALRHAVLPPTINVRRPDPRLGLEGSPFHLATEARPWIAPPDRPRRAGLSSFGFGGSNFHAVLEEYRGPGRRPPPVRALPAELVLVSGPSRGEVSARLSALSGSVRTDEDLPPAAAGSQDAFDPCAPVRLGLVAGSRAELESLAAATARVLSGDASALPSAVVLGEGPPDPGGLAFLFAGQGSQYVGMGRALAVHLPPARAAWDANAHLEVADGLALHRVVFAPTAFDDETARARAAALTDTEAAQPALAVTVLAQLAVLGRLGIAPDAVAGHSFGELMALHAAGALEADAAVRLAAARGRAMAEAAAGTPGAMLAVMAGREQVEAATAGEPGVVVANDNAPAQVVLSGEAVAIERARTRLSAGGMTVSALAVSTAFHSALVAPAAETFARALARETLGAPETPVFANTTAGEYPTEPEAAARLLAGQLAAPVRFRETVEALYAKGVRTFLEVGPSATLTGLVGATLAERPHRALAMDRKGTDGIVQLWRTLAGLAVNGRSLDFAALRRDLPVPARAPEPPAHALMLNGANYNKPYPRHGESAAMPEAPAAHGAGVNAPPTERCAPDARPDRNALAPDGPPSPGPSGLPAPTSAGHIAAAATPRATACNGPVPPAPPAVPSPPATHEAGPRPMTDDPSDRIARMHEAMAREHGRFLEQAALSHRTFLEASARAIEAMTGAGAERPSVPSQPVSAALPPAAPNGRDPAMSAAGAAPSGPGLNESGAGHDAGGLSGHPVSGGTAPATEADAFAPASTPSELSAARDRWPHGGQTPGDTPVPEAAAPQGPPPTEGLDATSDILAIVAERTGYPVEMLEPEMELEADLGIDSIKQVEIFSAIQETMPHLGELPAEALAEVRTLGDISRMLGARAGGHGTAAPRNGEAENRDTPLSADEAADTANGPDPAAAFGVQAPAVAAGEAGPALVIEVVAELTGYPAEMLDADMELEADLGIDSIKQVEILSALGERHPDLAQIDPVTLGEIRTLRDVMAAVEGKDPGGEPPAPGQAEAGEGAGAEIAAPIRLAALGAGPDAEEPGTGVSGVLRTVDPNAPSEVGLAGAARPGLSRLAVVLEESARPSWTQAPARTPVPVEITAEAPAFADALAAAFEEEGHPARVVETPTGEAEAVVCTAGLSALDPVAAACAGLAAAVAASPAMERPGALFVALQDTGGDFARGGTDLSEAALGSMTGLVKTAALEWPEADVRAIDLGGARRAPAEAARRAVAEILGGSGEVEVGLAPDGRRLVPVLRPVAEPAGAAMDLPGGAFVVASGGARGVTAGALVRLCRGRPLRLLLLGRSAAEHWPDTVAPDLDRDALLTALGRDALANGEGAHPREIAARADRLLAGREIRETLAALEAAGSEVRYASVDVTDADAVAAAVAERRAAWGPVAGIVHGSGVLADRLIRDRAGEGALDQAARVLAVKIHGLEALLDAAGEDEPAFVALFSSVAARQGNPGQADYAMANEALNRMAWALSRRWPEARVSAINWGPWDGGMVTEGLRRHFAEQGAGLIPLDAGASTFVSELLSGHREEVETVIAAGAGPGRLRGTPAETAPGEIERALS